ncbi:MAG: integrase core domain-containing protein [Bacteroidetes bacterium]|nr:integrase core domain-containing protein [Bacteroidota bacterium]MDF1866801.1 integrase core domain-containing protein [Saprospiraceae bacterium]
MSMDGVGRATDNAFIERLWRTVKYENVRFSEYTDGLKLIRGMDDYFPKYNNRRHSSLNRKRPKEVYENGLIGISNNRQN